MVALAGLFPANAQIQFEEIHRKAGIDFQLQTGATGQFHQIELMAGGVAAFDFDGDGCTDLFFANGASIPSLRKSEPKYYNRLYRNNCNGTFTDVTAKSGVKGEGYSIAVATADFDNDGLPDIFVAGVNGNILYRNRGDGTFEDVTAKAGLNLGKMWAVSAGWFDYDNDGWLDLFVSNYVAWASGNGTAVRRARCQILLPSECIPRASQSVVSQQPRRHVYRCVASFRHRPTHRQGNGRGFRRF